MDRYKSRIDSDAVISLLHEIDRELVEQTFVVPTLDKFAEQIGFKRTVGITHYLRAIKLLYEDFNLHGPEEDQLIAHVQSFELHQFASFLRRKYASAFEQCGVTYPWTKSDWEKFTKKHFGDQNRSRVLVKELTTRDPFLRELANSGGHWSKSYVEAIMQIRREIREQWKQTETSIDKILEM